MAAAKKCHGATAAAVVGCPDSCVGLKRGGKDGGVGNRWHRLQVGERLEVVGPARWKSTGNRGHRLRQDVLDGGEEGGRAWLLLHRAPHRLHSLNLGVLVEAEPVDLRVAGGSRYREKALDNHSLGAPGGRVIVLQLPPRQEEPDRRRRPPAKCSRLARRPEDGGRGGGGWGD